MNNDIKEIFSRLTAVDFQILKQVAEKLKKKIIILIPLAYVEMYNKVFSLKPPEEKKEYSFMAFLKDVEKEWQARYIQKLEKGEFSNV